MEEIRHPCLARVAFSPTGSDDGGLNLEGNPEEMPEASQACSRGVALTCHPRSPDKKAMHPVRACKRGGMETVGSSATPRLCHPSRVRALFAPVSGGGAARHTPATGWVPSGNWVAAVWVPEGRHRKCVAGRWRSRATTGLRKRAMHPVRACERGGMQTVRSSAKPRLCHPFRVRALFAPASGGGALRATHRLPAGFPPGTGWRLFGFLKGGIASV